MLLNTMLFIRALVRRGHELNLLPAPKTFSTPHLQKVLTGRFITAMRAALVLLLSKTGLFAGFKVNIPPWPIETPLAVL